MLGVCIFFHCIHLEPYEADLVITSILTIIHRSGGVFAEPRSGEVNIYHPSPTMRSIIVLPNEWIASTE